MNGLRYLNTVLTLLAVLLALQLWTSWTQSPDLSATAEAAIPDAGAQREQIVDELKLLNRNVGDLKSLLTSGKVKVMLHVPAKKDEPRD